MKDLFPLRVPFSFNIAINILNVIFKLCPPIINGHKTFCFFALWYYTMHMDNWTISHYSFHIIVHHFIIENVSKIGHT